MTPPGQFVAMRDDDVAYASRDLAKDPRVVSSADLGDIVRREALGQHQADNSRQKSAGSGPGGITGFEELRHASQSEMSKTLRYVLDVVYPCVCERELSGRRAEAILDWYRLFDVSVPKI
jgi:hypothetical protein